MASLSKTQWLVIAGALLVTVLVYFAPRVSDSDPASLEKTEAGFNHEELAEKARGFLNDSLKQKEEVWSELAESDKESAKKEGFDSLSTFWYNLGQPLLAAVYAEKAAQVDNTKESWKRSGDLFLQTARNTQDESRNRLFRSASHSFEKAIELGDTDLDTRVELGSSYVEGGSDPMQGINVLRGVLQADSTNIKAHLNLAYFSVRSGQLDKAIERFHKVLELDPTYHDAYVYLGDVYERNGDIENAIVQYEKFRETVTDSVVAGQIDRYLEKLRNSINH